MSRVSNERRATTLVEMVATMSVLLVLGISSVRMLSTLTDIGTQTVDRNDTRASIERLARALRADAELATEISAQDWPLSMELSTPTGDRTVRYQYDQTEPSVQRSVFQQSGRIAIDRFRLPPDVAPDLIETDGLVRLKLVQSPAISWNIDLLSP